MEKIRKIVHSLRQRPEEDRRHILHLLTMFSVAVLFVLWIFTLRVSLKEPETKVKAKKDLEPFSVLKENLVGGLQSISSEDSVPTE